MENKFLIIVFTLLLISTSCAENDQNKYDKLIATAEKSFLAKNYKESIINYKKAIGIQSIVSKVSDRLNLAKAYSINGNDQEAISHLYFLKINFQYNDQHFFKDVFSKYDVIDNKNHTKNIEYYDLIGLHHAMTNKSIDLRMAEAMMEKQKLKLSNHHLIILSHENEKRKAYGYVNEENKKVGIWYYYNDNSNKTSEYNYSDNTEIIYEEIGGISKLKELRSYDENGNLLKIRMLNFN